jgi:hypothetical protein
MLTAALAGCSYPPPGRLVYGHCGWDSHTESYPRAKDPRKAYGCKSDDDGYLEAEGQGDKPRN